MSGYSLRDGLWVSNNAIFSEQEQRIAALEKAVMQLKGIVETLQVVDSMTRLGEDKLNRVQSQGLDVEYGEPIWSSSPIGENNT